MTNKQQALGNARPPQYEKIIADAQSKIALLRQITENADHVTSSWTTSANRTPLPPHVIARIANPNATHKDRIMAIGEIVAHQIAEKILEFPAVTDSSLKNLANLQSATQQ